MPDFLKAIKALRQLGRREVGAYAWYQLLLRTGTLRRQTPCGGSAFASWMPAAVRPLLNLPSAEAVCTALGSDGVPPLLAEADQVVDGQARLFGGEPVPLNLSPAGSNTHWTLVSTVFKEGSSTNVSDIKFTWEPARFGWAFTLGRAYHLTGDERYPAAFWRYAEQFWAANPVNCGPNWESAQEVALRLMAFSFAAQVFALSIHTTSERRVALAQSIAAHAERIPPTLSYALAQNNNHLLSEAAGLITAGLALPDHPHAARWLSLGRRWFTWGLKHQIAPDGAYCQHSANYHRLMVQLALWVQAIDGIHQSSISNLQSAIRWLLALVDPETGRVPNLGPNDGAYIFPLTVCPFDDHRPVLQAAAQVYLGERPFGSGKWDEMSLWLACSRDGHPCSRDGPSRLQASHSWAYLRVAQFNSRPGHADQLHLDLWWRGLNVAQDPGTYLYNAPPPWDNALSRTRFHNTVTINGLDQMTPAGKFLWLDWAQAEVVANEQAADGSWQRLTAQHNGYRRLGIVHQRQVTVFADPRRGDRWRVEDTLLNRRPDRSSENLPGLLHWLLPDWPWELNFTGPVAHLRLRSPHGWITLTISSSLSPIPLSPDSLFPAPLPLSLIRAGELLYGPGPADPIRGWTSPTYGHKIPALSVVVEAVGPLPLTFSTEWIFP